MSTVEEIAQEMLLYGSFPKIQHAQTAMRKDLINTWNIPEGSTVLEIGCGQGDLTAVLADAVGPHGRVLAIDPAGPTYGDPVSIGDSTRHLAKGRYADIVEFKLNCDVLGESSSLLQGKSFDYVVLAHCSWYFDSPVALSEILTAAHDWAPILCISDWNLCADDPEQFAHMLAVLLHGLVEAYHSGSDANVRSPYALPWLKELLSECGWHEEVCTSIECGELLDGLWEIDSCLSEIDERASQLPIPSRVRSLVRHANTALEEVAGRFGKKTLSSFAIRARS
jgi:SAM-dependent methyltransferase